MLPHSRAKLKRVRSSLTKCRATSGKPFCCKYAMMDWPHKALLRIMASTWSNLRCMSANLNTYSVVSTCGKHNLLRTPVQQHPPVVSLVVILHTGITQCE